MLTIWAVYQVKVVLRSCDLEYKILKIIEFIKREDYKPHYS